MFTPKEFYVADRSNTRWAVEECGLALLCTQTDAKNPRRTPFYFETAKLIAADLSAGLGIEMHVAHFDAKGVLVIDYTSMPK